MDRVADRMAIMDTLYLYAELIDSGQNDQVAAQIFAQDGVVDMGLGPVIAGFDELHPFYSSHPSFTKYPADLDGLRHDVTNIRVRFHNEDVAESNSRVMAWHWHNSHRHEGLSRTADFAIAGIYHDDWRRTESGWKISRRRGGQCGTGVAFGQPPESFAPLLAALLGRIPTWGGAWVDTPFSEIKHD